MSALDDPRYKALVVIAMGVVGTDVPEIGKGMTAQWTCELGHGDTYPPARNNPGNIARDAASDVGATYVIGPNPPQPANPIVTFATPEYGAATYGEVLRTLPRYAAVRAAIASGDPYAFMHAIDESGYGGGYACMASVYRAPEDDPPASIGLPPNGARAWVVTDRLARIWSMVDGCLRHTDRPTPAAFTFTAYVGSKSNRIWAPGPLSSKRYSGPFRRVYGPPHVGWYIRTTDQGITTHQL